VGALSAAEAKLDASPRAVQPDLCGSGLYGVQKSGARLIYFVGINQTPFANTNSRKTCLPTTRRNSTEEYTQVYYLQSAIITRRHCRKPMSVEDALTGSLRACHCRL
jgi:hypothetical protein